MCSLRMYIAVKGFGLTIYKSPSSSSSASSWNFKNEEEEEEDE